MPGVCAGRPRPEQGQIHARTAGDIAMKVGVAKETVSGERRVALIPEAVEKLRAADISVLVEREAGAQSWYPDIDYVEAGAKIVTASALYDQSDVVLKIHRPSAADIKLTHPDQVIIGMLAPLLDPTAMPATASLGITAVSLDAIPRTLSRAQGMDALSSQANVAGYKAVLVAAEAFGRYFPLLTTPAGTARPANVLVLGVGGAGLKAGSIISDMAASDLGGNCELSRPGKVTTTPNGVAIHAPLNLPASMPTGASVFYARNMSNLLLNFVTVGELRFDFEDEVTAATVITFGGKVVQEATKKLLQPASRGGAKA